MNITFCGAAQCVTGSCHLISFNDKKILVDCGMRQGEDAKSDLGESDFPFNPGEIGAVLVTHAHIDHTGLLPLLVKKGFKGEIFATGATAQLCSIMLPDSGHIQEQEAAYTNRKNERAGKPLVEPLYTAQDAVNAAKQFRPVQYDKMITVLDGVQARFTDVGHLLGSAAIEVWVEEKGKKVKVAFSGDVGRNDRPIICDPESVESADYLVMEGTYGDRNHDASTDKDKEEQFAKVLRAGIARGGNIVIPSFAVGRTQELLIYIRRLLEKGAVPGLEKVPVYIDSPLGISATEIYAQCAKEYYDEESLRMSRDGNLFDLPTLRVAETAEESKAINDAPGPKIIISASGMCDAGRIRHHLKHNLYRADSTVIFAGYQAVGTLGRILLDGAEKVKIFGEEVRVNAAIERIESFSGHAGRDELIDWLAGMQARPTRVFLVHGEPEALKSLCAAISSLGYSVEIPELLETYDLIEGTERKMEPAVIEKRQQKKAVGQRANAIRLQAQRILALMDGLTVPEDDMRLRMMETDVRQLADKWEEFLKRS